MKKLAITGITGKNGKVLFEYILDNSSDIAEKWSGIRFLVRNPMSSEFIEKSDLDIPFEICIGDAFSSESVSALLNGCDTVLHISGITQSLNIIRAGITCGVRRFILVHTTGIYSKFKEAGENYRNIEAEIEKLEKDNDIKVTILRPTMIYGSMNDHNVSVFTDMAARMKCIPVISGGKYEVQPVNCRDLGKAFFQVLINEEKCKEREYILSGERPVMMKDLFKLILKELGLKKKIISCPFFIAYTGAVLLWILTGKKKDFREKVQRMCESRAYSHEKASEDFGYSPMKLEDGIKEEVRLYKETGLIK